MKALRIVVFFRLILKAIAYIFGLLVLFSCNNEQFEQCKEENERLISEKKRRDSIIKHLNEAYVQIDSTSMVIAAKKAKINELAQQPLTEEEKTIILAEIDTINLLIENNKSNVNTLQGNLGGGGLEDGFKYMVKSMDEKNVMEDAQMTNVKRDLAVISKDFSDLFEEYVYKEAENMELSSQLSSKEAELIEAQKKLNRAKEKLRSGWYVIGTKDELKEKGLIYKKGLFDIKEVNKDFDRNLFKKVDIHELNEVLLDTKKAEIITTHPSESYEMKSIKRKVNKLVIKEPELFWSVSKFLIIETEN